jgi:tol-pal system protein YbgF
VTRIAAGGALVATLALAGCASRAELVQQDRELRRLVGEQRRQLQQVEKELEQLRAAVEERGGPVRGSAAGDRIAKLERRLAQLEAGQAGGVPPPPPTEEPETVPPPPVATPPTPPPTAPPPAAPPEDDAWRRDVAKEQAVAGTVNVPERAEYLGILDGLARKECARAMPALNSFAAKYRESPLADNALYWVARCDVLQHDLNAAISKFYEVVTRYPKGDKVPAALWAQGNLFIDMGNTPDARIVLGKLIREFPSSEEASRARQRLAELQN